MLASVFEPFGNIFPKSEIFKIYAVQGGQRQEANNAEWINVVAVAEL